MPVKLASDLLTGSRKKGQLKLERNVAIEQGALKLRANKAQVFFVEGTEKPQRILATGRVRMNGVDPETALPVRASGETAEFDVGKQQVVLRGKAQLHKGNDTIVGDFIEYNIATGWIKAGRVTGVVQQEAGKPGK